MKFTTKRETCIGCKSLLGVGETQALCPRCEDKVVPCYQREIGKLAEFEERFARLWSQCQRCQGSLHQDVLCTSKDCPIFYMRKKVQKDLSDQQSVVDRFGEAW